MPRCDTREGPVIQYIGLVVLRAIEYLRLAPESPDFDERVAILHAVHELKNKHGVECPEVARFLVAFDDTLNPDPGQYIPVSDGDTATNEGGPRPEYVDDGTGPPPSAPVDQPG